MEVLVIYGVCRGQFEFEIVGELPVHLLVIGTELIQTQLKSLTKFDSYLLLFLKYEFVILHVLFRVGLEIRTNLMQIQAFLVRTFLSAHEKLTEF